MSTSTQETRVHAGELAGRLTQLMENAHAACKRIENLTDEMEERSTCTINEIEAAKDELSSVMRKLLEESHQRMTEMNVLARQMRTMTEGTTERILQAIHRAAQAQTAASTPEERTNVS